MSDDPDALLVRADKKMVTTLTRWKPDYDAAAQLYEEAGGKFRALGRKRDAMIALEKCAHANAQTGDDWHAARCLEQCASLAKDVGTPANIVDYAERARDAYALANRQQRGAEAVGKIVISGRARPRTPRVACTTPPSDSSRTTTNTSTAPTSTAAPPPSACARSASTRRANS